jgi:hypothetical protein
MKRLKLILSAVALITVIAGVLAFKTKSQGTIWCAPISVTVNPDQSCSTQNGLTKVAFIPSGIIDGDTQTPCADSGISAGIPYVNTSTSCLRLPNGLYYVSTAP